MLTQRLQNLSRNSNAIVFDKLAQDRANAAIDRTREPWPVSAAIRSHPVWIEVQDSCFGDVPGVPEMSTAIKGGPEVRRPLPNRTTPVSGTELPPSNQTQPQAGVNMLQKEATKKQNPSTKPRLPRTLKKNSLQQ